MEKTKVKMKDSGVEWIGKIPEDWDVFRIKQLARQGYKTFIDGDWIESPYITDTGIRLIQTGNIGVGIYKEQGYRYISNETFHLLHCTEVKPGDVLICRLADPVGRACLAPDLNVKMITSVDVCILKPSKKFNSKFVVYFLSSHEYLDFLESLSRGGTRDRISRSMLGNIDFIAPSIEQQNRIVDHLDSKITITNRAIEQKRKLIDLLKEKRTAIINRAVTRGLDANVELVDSGVEWIGKVPKGWKVERLKSVANINRDVLSEDTPADHVINYLDIGDVESNGASSVPTVYTFENAPSRARRLVHDGTVILATVRTYLKAISYIENPTDNLIVSTGFATLDASKKVLSKYLYYLASSELIIQNVVRYSTGVSYPAIAPTVLGGLPVIYPSVEIQKQIIAHLDESLAAIDSAIERIQTSIRLLNEYRTSLISHVVTGKVEIYDRV